MLRLRDWNSLRQENNESCRDFADRVRKGSYGLSMTELHLMERFLSGLTGASDYGVLLESQLGSYADLYELADAADAMRQSF